MSDIVPSLLAFALFIIALTTITSTVLTSADDIRLATEIQETRSLVQTGTEINAPPDRISLQASSTIELTLLNEGNITLADFSNWDVIAEIKQATTTAISYLSYTTSTSPSANEWTLLGIYNSASTTPRIAETFSPGVLDPGESMVALLNPSPSVVSDTYDRVTFVTPSGVTAKVIFEIRPTLIYVVDATDNIVYAYKTDGSFYGTDTLDSGNGDARGITTKGQGFWTVDDTDDLMYRYSASFFLTSTSTLENTNQRGSGVTTDGNNIWVTDDINLDVPDRLNHGLLILCQ
jgi:hypothetical protein